MNFDIYTYVSLITKKCLTKVKHGQLMQLWENKKVDSKDRRIIKELYCNQRGTINVEGDFSQED